MQITVHVTEDDIKNGTRGSHTCPVALAIRRTVGQDLGGVVGDRVRVSYEPSVVIPLSERVGSWVAAYDRREDVQPFAFRFDPGKRISTVAP